ncbi:uncharacterized protein LOC124261496 [Haliotis rubra]|uniref:uncharacterized protein LOC124261496 n=1 Tax=Haliotis rubra TaxID=36100 RepID=UPI001EE61ABD|nr:uncharacterized protein LOC124261496 [Haliotis rubra]
MMIPRASLLLLPLAGVIFLAVHAVQGSEPRRVCYYTNWSQYRPGKGKYTPENVDPNLCTHYVYAFATLLGNRIKAFEWNDLSTQWSKGMFERFMAMKNVNPNMKTLLAVGGWNLGSGPFHQMSHTPEGRKEFADSVVKFIRENKFDGVDVDWEYPANRGSPPEDRQHYTEMLKAVYDAFVVEAQQSGRPRLMLTAAVAAGKPNIDTAYDIPEISQILDFISVMTYDLHGSWEDHTGHNSPLYSRIDESQDDKYLNLHWAAEYWVKMGAPREKLNIGLALYGRTFTLSTGDNTLGAPASGPGTKGPYTREKGFLSYQEICEMEQNGGTIVDIPEQRVRYITRGDQWVGYDDKLSLREKVCYIKTNGFGGVMVWALDLDDFSGSDCGQGRYPLLHAIVDELASPDRTNCVGPGPHQDINHGSVTTQRPVTTPTKAYTPPPVVVTNQPPVTNGPVNTPPRIQPGKDFSCYGRVSDFYQSPYSCSEYFICANGMSFRVNCAVGLRFNPQTKYCDRAANVPCNIGTNTQWTTHAISKRPQVTTTPPPTTTTTTTTSTTRATVKPVTAKPYTPAPLTPKPTTQKPYTPKPTTQKPYTQKPYTRRGRTHPNKPLGTLQPQTLTTSVKVVPTASTLTPTAAPSTTSASCSLASYDKQKALLEWQNDTSSISKRGRFKHVQIRAQALRKVQDEWWEKEADEVQRYTDSQKSKMFFRAIKELGQSSGMDGVPAKSDDPVALEAFHSLLTSMWEEEELPKDFRDAEVVSLFKKKGSKTDCGNHWGISLLFCPRPRPGALARSPTTPLVLSGGEVSEPFDISNGVKQGWVLAPVLFNVFFACVLNQSVRDLVLGVYPRHRLDGSMFDLLRLSAKTKTVEKLILAALFADGCALMAHKKSDLQLITRQERSPVPDNTRLHPLAISTKRTHLNTVDDFKHLGSTDRSLDKDISSKIGKASQALGRLRARVLKQHNIKLSTQLKVYRTVVLTSLLYGLTAEPAPQVLICGRQSMTGRQSSKIRRWKAYKHTQPESLTSPSPSLTDCTLKKFIVDCQGEMIPRTSLLLLPLAGVIFLALHAVQGSEPRRVCYYTNWSQYRPGKGKFTPENVDPNLCTHYVYAFAILLGNKVKAFEWNDLSTQWSKGMFERFIALKTVNPNMKTLLAVGGWNFGPWPFHQMSHTPKGRKEFADSVVKFIRENKFDGVDVDWEYPANRGSPPEDKHHYTEMLKALHDAFVVEAQQSGRPRLMLTAAVAAEKSIVDTAYDIPKISQILDFISVMTYDLHGSWEDHTGHNLNLHWAAEYWVKMGAPREKLNIGLALYGRTFTLSTADNTLGAPVSGPGAAGPYTREKGFISYQEICEMEQTGGTIVDIPEQRVRYITRGDQWVGYDDKLSLRDKVCYIKSNGFGGVMVWTLDLDDFSGSACFQGPYPLLHAIVDELVSPDRTYCVGSRTHLDINYGSVNIQPVVVKNQLHRLVNIFQDFFCYGRVSDFYPSPFSGTEYFICANGKFFRVTCAVGLRFNPQTKYCDRAANVPGNIGTTTQWNPSATNIDDFCQGRANGLYTDPYSCSKYYQCFMQLGFVRTCPHTRPLTRASKPATTPTECPDVDVITNTCLCTNKPASRDLLCCIVYVYWMNVGKHSITQPESLSSPFRSLTDCTLKTFIVDCQSEMIPRASLLLLPLAGVIFLALHAAQGSEPRRVCYYTNWSQYRPGKGKFTPENVDPNLCTHYVYAFAILLGNKVKAFEWNDLSTQWSKGMFERFIALKTVNPTMKTLLAVGGWNFGSKGFHEMCKTPEGRKEFADSVVKFIRENNFDGVDVDWEYPANRGSPPEDTHYYTEMLKAVHDAIAAEAQQSGRPRLLFTAAVAAGKPTIDTAYEIPEISKILDYISVMTYDLHGSWENITGHNSPLYSRIDESPEDKSLNLHWAAEYWVKMGAPREKINIGLALYGRTFTLSTADNTLGAPVSGPGTKGPYTREEGFLSYQEICEMEQNGGTIVDIPEQRVRYITRDDQWVGYDDKLSLREKVCYIKSSGFGGVMVWALDLDDFSGSDCGQGPYPLLHTIVDELASPDRTNCVGPGPHQDINHGSVTTQRPVTTTRKTYTTPSVVVTNQPQVTNGPVYTTPRTQPRNDFCYGRMSDYYPSPNSCTKYILCVSGKSIGRSCTMGLLFNPQTKYCDRAANVQCNIGTNTQRTTHFISTTAPPPTSTTTPSTQRPYTQRPFTQSTYNPTSRQIQSGKDFCYGRATDFYQSPFSCTEYIRCVSGMSFRLYCTMGFRFNPKTKSCDLAANVPCNIGPNTQWTTHFISTTAPPPTSTTTTTTSTRRPTVQPITSKPYTPLPFTWKPATQRPYTPFVQTTYNPTYLDAFCRGRANGLYRDPSDCSKFYQCNAHIGFLRNCPPSEAFNENSGTCDFPFRVPGC